MSSKSTFFDLLRDHAANTPSRNVYTFLQGDREIGSLSYESLDRRARAIAAHLQERGLEGQRVLLLYAPGLQFIEAFIGCLYAGAIAVPAYPPEPGRLERSLPRFQAIVDDAEATAALTTGPILGMFSAAAARFPALQKLAWLASDQMPDGAADSWRRPAATRDSLAFLQYTSGSTSMPKGVMVSHHNILINEQVIQEAFGHSSQSLIVGWLPFYHDMGLIGNILQPAYLGSSAYLMSPMEFLQRPIAWIQAISKYRAVTSGGPNFAYDLCVRKLKGAGELDLDLSHWKVAFNGAEPIRAESLRRFAEAFARYGFDSRAFFPCYGLAESTLFVTGVTRGEGAPIRAYDTDELQAGKAAPASAAPQPKPGRELVGSGHVFGDHECRIVDPQTRLPSAPGVIGEIWVAGPSVVSGYWRRPEDTVETFGAKLATAEGPGDRTYLRTGDLGFFDGGELYVTGRRKDLIIIRGRNHYPQDIEETVQKAYPGLRPGCSAAFSVDVDGEESLVVVQEVGPTFDGNVEQALAAIRRAIAQGHELQTHGVVLLKQGSLLKTSSGKIQRRGCKASFLAGTLEAVATSVQASAPAAAAAGPIELPSLEGLAGASGPARLELVRRYAVAQAAKVIEVPLAAIELGRPLTELGLDSLRAIELKHELDEAFGGDLAIGELLGDAPFGRLVEQLAAAAPAAPRSGKAAPSDALSYGQRALWYLHQLAPESSAYNISAAVRLRPAPDLAAMRAAVAALVERHPILRTTYHTRDGVPYQQVAAELPVDDVLQVLDVGAGQGAGADELLHAEAARPFDLERGPILRLRMVPERDGMILLVAVHHIAADFWSLETLAVELGKLYDAAVAQRDAALGPAPEPYASFVGWQAELLGGDKGAASLRHWAQALAGAPAALALPTDKPRPTSPSYRGGQVSFTVPAEVAQGLRKLAEREGATLFSALLAAYQVLLGRYAMQDDVLVGVPVAGRSRRELAPVVGYFVNSVVFRGQLGGDPSFREHLRRTKQVAREALDHQDLPFPLLVEKLRPQREPGRSPLFQAMFSLQQARDKSVSALAQVALGHGSEAVSWETLSLEGYPLRRRIAQFDVALELAEAGEALAGVFEFAEELFEEETVRRMSAHFVELLRSAVAYPDFGVKALNMMPAEEVRTQLTEWNQRGAATSSPATALELWARQVAADPQRVALVGEGKEWSAAALDRRADELARRLCDRGVGAGATVVVMMPRTLDMIATVLAVLKTGAAYVPVDLNTPAQRVAFVARDCAAKVLVTASSQLERAAALELSCPVLYAEAEAEAESGAPTTSAFPAVAADSPAYIIYTSGTSGQPKGVVVLHRNLGYFAQVSPEAYGARAGDRLLQFASLAFDTSVEEIFMSLCNGLTLVLRDDAMLESSATFLRRVGELGISILDLPTAYWNELVTSTSAEDWQRAASLRAVIVGGDKVTVERLRRWHELIGPRVRLLNSYGPTESTIVATVADLTEVGPDQLTGMSVVSIGRPLPGARVYLVDEALRLVPTGAAGELCIAGAGVTRGYLNAPELSEARFPVDPFDAAGARLYRTGDKARFSKRGELQYLGRLDQQVKIRGYRVELGEIEATLLAFPGMRAAAVLADSANGGEPRLVAYLEADERAALTVPALRAFVKERLPAYMVPSLFVQVAAMPMSSSGKIDRNALPRPGLDNTLRDDSIVSARTPDEARMIEIWKRVLQLEQIGVHDNFFDVGGHSLLLPVLLAEIRKEFQRDVAMVTLLERPTISASAELFAAEAEAAGGDRVVERGKDRAARMREMAMRQRRDK